MSGQGGKTRHDARSEEAGVEAGAAKQAAGRSRQRLKPAAGEAESGAKHTGVEATSGTGAGVSGDRDDAVGGDTMRSEAPEPGALAPAAARPGASAPGATGPSAQRTGASAPAAAEPGAPARAAEAADAVARHPIGVVSERTGLSQEVLRVWERRYGAVVPARTESGQRQYTDEDVERLRLLRQATRGGRSIGSVARLSVEDLTRMVREDEEAGARRVDRGAALVDHIDPAGMLAHVRALDGDSLEAGLRRLLVVHGVALFLESVVAPLMRSIGEEWHAGRLSPAHEHMATAVVQAVVLEVLLSLAEEQGSPVFVSATPMGERHEIGALLAATVAAAEGWRAVYLGPDLPADEIAAAALVAGAAVVGLSVIFLLDRDNLVAEVRRLRELLPASVPLLVGGAGAGKLAGHAGDADLLWIDELETFRSLLGRWRSAPQSRGSAGRAPRRGATSAVRPGKQLDER